MSPADVHSAGDAATLLARQYGLDPAAIGPTVLRAALDEAAAGLSLSVPAFSARLAEPGCVEALFSALPVGLSWFDRDAAQLRSAASWAAAQRRPIRVLSAPCARGEEVWSLAGALLDAGVDAAQAQIIGIDAMPAAIARAEAGGYPPEAGRGVRERSPWWLIESDTGFQVHPRLRSMVRFQTGNLLDPAVLGDVAPFDLIFSRNFLIYLTPSGRRQWIGRIRQLLAPGGRVYVAASEPLAGWSSDFDVCPEEVHGACRRAAPVRPQTDGFAAPAAADVIGSPSRTDITRSRGGAGLRTKVTAPRAAVPPASPRGAGPDEDPRRLADAGALEAAEALLAPRLARAVPATDDLVTAALIALARGQSDPAEIALRRALYLDHHHAEAGALLAVLLEQRGETGTARRLRARSGARA